MERKEYHFDEGFTIKPRRANGRTFIGQSDVFDLYREGKVVRTYDFFRDALDAGLKMFSNKQTTTHK
jgi:hypothetical protein